MNQPTIVLLFVEDDLADQQRFIQYMDAQRLPYFCIIAANLSMALERLKKQPIDVILSNCFFPDGNVLDLLRHKPTAPIIVITRHADVSMAVQVIRGGAHDYLVQDEEGNYLSRIPEVIMDALQARRSQEAEHERHALAELLRDTAETLNSTLELNEILRHILENVKCIVPHDASSIMLIEGMQARIVQMNGWTPEEMAILAAVRLNVAEVDHLNLMYQTHKFCIIPDVDAVSSWVRFPNVRVPRSCLAAPLCVGESVIGFLHLDSMTPQFFTALHAERLSAFVNQAATALKNAQLYRKAQELAALEERQRLARDLHDSVTQTLFAASILSNAIIRQWKTDPTSIGNELRELRDLTQGALAEMRTLLLELRPSALLEADLSDLIRQLTETIKGRSRMRVTYHAEGKADLPPNVHVAFFRLAQEALNNVLKHARAQHVKVQLHRAPERVELLVQDDGRGFDPHSVSGDRLGIHIMHERAREAGIQLTLTSKPNEGTQLRAIWTVEAES
ncbi:MAG: histidine kinase [Anaerolineae bacterium]|nr:histidine kinase [Anaerolineae bacterium]